MAQSDVKARIGSVQNIRKITRAMEMVSAARLRKAEDRASSLRPYADALRRMTRQAAAAAGAGELQSQPVLRTHDQENTVGLVLVTADRGLAGAFNSQILRAGLNRASELEAEGKTVTFYSSGRRGVSSLTFRNKELAGQYTGFTDAPSARNASDIADDLVGAFVDDKIDRVEVFYNSYISPLVQEVRQETLLPLAAASVVGGDDDVADESTAEESKGPKAMVEYEPDDPAELLAELVPEFVQVSLLRALLESAASEHGARMSAMRSASENAADVIKNLTLAMNRARQADITQEIMEIVAGAEALN
ncbi:ATP synthase F1 subunit gamma [Patulibacter sp.]|uniref:ATP synthase F1 subunit gamma n=1 Tax=Patulibacter sp. TaxID=1912859 RepID=UPI0027249E3C|nr:ATP synthase F1 subunit gamma [Patulibacter sp.]MDO9408499.1 ATP synthase F1 subunit gamma [Patulibacter sp.]